MGDQQPRVHGQRQLDQVAGRPDALECDVGSGPDLHACELAIDPNLCSASPAGHAEHYGESLLGRLLDLDLDLFLPGVVCPLDQGQWRSAGQRRLQAAAAIEVHPHALGGQAVGPIVQPGDRARHLGRAAVAIVGEPALVRVVAEGLVLVAVPAQGVGVKEARAVRAHGREHAVVQHLLHPVGVTGLAGDVE